VERCARTRSRSTDTRASAILPARLAIPPKAKVPHVADESCLYPISIKGVVVIRHRVVLLKNCRGEWDLPGGRIERGETSAGCVVREVAEETRLAVTVGPILDSGLRCRRITNVDVFVVTYACYPQAEIDPVLSNEHVGFGLFSKDDVVGLDLDPIYRRSIMTWFGRLP
jgi:8-oxo-dGTP pyrophosphatase MutT (NUDIX family)